MANADQLRDLLLTGFEQLSGPWQGYADALAGRARTDIERENEDRAKGIIENTYGRGLGLSTIATEMQYKREQARNEALVKARVDAELAARQAQLAAMGRAAGVVDQEMNRRQQASQYEREYGLRERALNQQGEQGRASLRQQRSASNAGALATGFGGLGGAALQMTGLLFADKIKSALTGKPTAAPTAGGGFESLDIPVGSGAEQVSAGAPFTVAPAPTFDLGPQTFDVGPSDFGYTAPAPATGFDSLSQPWSQSYDWHIGSWGDYAPTGSDYLTRDRDWGWYL